MVSRVSPETSVNRWPSSIRNEMPQEFIIIINIMIIIIPHKTKSKILISQRCLLH